MAFYRGSSLSLQQSTRILPVISGSAKQSRAFCGNTRGFCKIYRVSASRIREGDTTHHGHGIVASPASSPEPPVVRKELESPPRQEHSPGSWVERWLPAAARPYALLARIDKPDAIWLYAWPCFWSIALAANKAELPDMKMLALFGFGTVILRGAACTMNDLLDRGIDKKVERTKSRPLASGALTAAQGFYFLVFQVLLWFGFLLQLNNRSLIMGASWLVLFFSYPLMKRLIHWPQAFLGFTVSCGVFIGSAAIKESLDYAVLLPMYFAGICWTLVYDTIYAHQDKKDDFKAGVKSTVITFGDNTKYWLSGFGAACVSSLALTGYNADLAWPYYPFLAAAAGHLAWQVSTVDLSNKSDCHMKFVSNKWFGAFLFGGILCGVLAK
ncbi:4-hydroxybenzoate polyprenyltransferase, mitochondrial-like [Panicum virgatum]|uniref:4-hydroxybenzoate polyprenyltransferase, mitochondrial n=1 Tax=Panicum virgatum TaxID=38727 RepID=A0A8T0T810_PANVG|nr:4-hydroxybenzoate polyprenyltransferase, mitochondrial-like [Panicum virgatum]KAG2605758.1 hypothetical protein PVAP13_4NG220200 [Panicum virgatum]